MPRLAHPDSLLAVQGIRAMGVAAGLKKERPDVALIVSDSPNTTGAAVFTQNAFAGAPIHLSRQHVANGDVRAIVVNSGNANACTGRQGLRDALNMARTSATWLGIEPDQILVASTGIIGRPLPIDKVVDGIERCATDLDNAVGDEVAQAILTTDSGPKQASERFMVAGKECVLAGIAKGAGMIHPNMATMLAFMATDANIPAPALRQALLRSTSVSFNQISVDGDESTNDMAAILATGAASDEELAPGHPDWEAFQGALDTVTQRLAKQIASDGEGATKLLEVVVEGTDGDGIARAGARAIASSNLVKSAVHGEDPNWGRIVSALGQAIDVDPTTVDIWVGNKMGEVQVLDQSEPTNAHEAARGALQAAEVSIRVRVGTGTGAGTAWGCDLTPDYVTFNSAYTT